MRRALMIVMIFAVVFLVACGGDEGWDAEAREEFIAGCESSGTPNEACVCMQEKVEAKYPDIESPDEIEQADVLAIAKECIDA